MDLAFPMSSPGQNTQQRQPATPGLDGSPEDDITLAPLSVSRNISVITSRIPCDATARPDPEPATEPASPIHSIPVSEAITSDIDPLSRGSPVSSRENASSLAALVSKFEILDAVNNVEPPITKASSRLHEGVLVGHAKSMRRAHHRLPSTTNSKEKEAQRSLEGSGGVSPRQSVTRTKGGWESDKNQGTKEILHGETDQKDRDEEKPQVSAGTPRLVDTRRVSGQGKTGRQGRLSSGLVAERRMFFEHSSGMFRLALYFASVLSAHAERLGSEAPPTRFRASLTFPTLKDPFAAPREIPKDLPKSRTWRTAAEEEIPTSVAASPSRSSNVAPIEQAVGVEARSLGGGPLPHTLPSRDKPNVANLRQSFEAAADVSRQEEGHQRHGRA